jgi:uncharacterized protein (TIGR03435 family)
VLWAGVSAQAPLTFDVISVKAGDADANFSSFRNSPGQFGITNSPVRTVITQAYGVQSHQLVDLPAWVSSERFTIAARPPEGTFTQDQRREMIRSLLADRFKLKAHMETRDLPIYVLVKGRTDGRPGPDLKPPVIDCVKFRADRAAAAKAAGPSAPPVVFRSDQMTECGMASGIAPGGGVNFRAQGMTMAQFARMMQLYVDRPLVEQTGLLGEFDLELSFLPVGGALVTGGVPPRVDQAAGDSTPSLFTALQERLGLKLDATRGPVEVLVIDRIERPTAD